MQLLTTQGLTHEQGAKVATLMGWDLSKPVALLMDRKGITPEDACKMESEYRRYQTLNTLYPQQRFPISNAVDEMWHAHLLFTRDYDAMSLATRGSFIHHHPTVNEAERVSLEPAYYNGTLPALEALFGPVDPVMWPASDQICWSCS